MKNAPAPLAIATTLARDIDDDSPAAPPCVTVAGKVVPAHGHTVAGDFWDTCEDSDGLRVVVVGDVVGHGAPAKPVAEELRALIRATAAETNDPSRLLSAANSRIARRHDSACIATALVMRLDPRLHELVWASAGHPWPYWLDDGLPLVHSAPGVPLGIDCGVIYRADRVPLSRRTGVLLYTDGVLDARGPGGARFGRERLGHLLRLSVTAVRRTPPPRSCAACAISDATSSPTTQPRSPCDGGRPREPEPERVESPAATLRRADQPARPVPPQRHGRIHGPIVPARHSVAIDEAMNQALKQRVEAGSEMPAEPLRRA